MSDITRLPSDPRNRKTEQFLAGIGLTRENTIESVATAASLSWRGLGSRYVSRYHEDFALAAGGTLPAPWAKQDTSSTGTPTADYIDDAANGEYTMVFDSDDEVETLTLYWGDQLIIDSAKQPYIEMGVKIALDTAFSADDRIVFGLASARNAALDSIAKHAWFRMEGANLDILVESDDGTTDTNDQDTGVDYVDDTYLILAIDFADLSAIKFLINGVQVATTSAPLMTGNLQPYIEMQKDAGVVVHGFVVDYIDIAVVR